MYQFVFLVYHNLFQLCFEYRLPYGPFLMALATSANVGSTATPVGNPQNMIIASLSGISYATFLRRIGPATVVYLGTIKYTVHSIFSGGGSASYGLVVFLVYILC